MNARVRQTLHAAKATQQQRLPVVGKIRPGIKVPTPKANAIPACKQAYHDGVAAGAGYDDISKAMKKADDKCPGFPLMPKNAAHFRVHPSDFTTPGAAQTIMDKYGEQRDGDTEPHLYSFPVVFPSDDLDVVFREQFEAWKTSELTRWSETDPATGDLLCMRKEELKPDKSRRKRWGGRQTEAVGKCNPNECDRFNIGDCKHHGSLYFWVPGVTGVGVIECAFTSVYASMGIMEILELVQTGLGRVKGTLGGKPIFRLSKVGQAVSVMDWQTGKAKRQAQQIISLEASGLDMTQVLAAQETPLLAAPEQPVALIGADTPVEQSHEQVDTETGEITQADEPIEGTLETAAEQEQPDPLVAPLRKKLGVLFKRLKWSADDVRDWVVGNYKTEAAAHDPQKLADMIGKLEKLPEVKQTDKNQGAPF